MSISDIKDKKYISESKEHISDIAVKDSGIKQVKKGTVIMSFKLSIGKTAIAEEDLFTNEAIMAFNIKDSSDSGDFLRKGHAFAIQTVSAVAGKTVAHLYDTTIQ